MGLACGVGVFIDLVEVEAKVFFVVLAGVPFFNFFDGVFDQFEVLLCLLDYEAADSVFGEGFQLIAVVP